MLRIRQSVKNFRQFYRDDIAYHKGRYIFLWIICFVACGLGIYAGISNHIILIRNNVIVNHFDHIINYRAGALTFYFSNFFSFLLVYCLIYFSAYKKWLSILTYGAVFYYSYKIFRSAVVLFYLGTNGILSAVIYYLFFYFISMYFILFAGSCALNNCLLCPQNKKDLIFELLFLFLIKSVIIILSSVILFFCISLFR